MLRIEQHLDADGLVLAYGNVHHFAHFLAVGHRRYGPFVGLQQLEPYR